MLAWLDGTDLHRALFLRKRLYNRLSSGLFNGNEMHKTNFDYAVGLVLSRALSGNLPVAGSNSEGDVREVPLTLAPVLDFCNHSSAFSNAQHAAAADGALVLSATVDVKAGEEILIDYGQGRDSLSFLTLYGFCPRESRFGEQVLNFNVNDRVELVLPDPAPGAVGGDVVKVPLPLALVFSHEDFFASSQVEADPIGVEEAFSASYGKLLDAWYTGATSPQEKFARSGALVHLAGAQLKLLDGVRFRDRESGVYLAKSKAEERFLDDCDAVLQWEKRALRLVVQALETYAAVLEAGSAR